MLTRFLKNDDIGLILPILGVSIAFILFVGLFTFPTDVNGSNQPDAPVNEQQFSWMHVLEGFLGGAAGVGVPLIIYWRELKNERKKAILRLCRSIKEELRDHIKMLDGSEYSSYLIKRSPEVQYRNIYFSTAIFDSVTHSGTLISVTEFNKEAGTTLMLGVADLYIRIKKHNEIIAYRTKHRDLHYVANKKEDRQADWEKEFLPYEEYLVSLETEIRIHTNGIIVTVDKLLKILE